MKTLIATFDHNYYLWQCLVQINNFMKYGYDEDTVYIVSTSNPSPVLKSIMNCPKIKSKFYLYKDERNQHHYPSSLRPPLPPLEGPKVLLRSRQKLSSINWLK